MKRCLVYLPNSDSQRETEGTTYIAEIQQVRGEWYDLILLTDRTGGMNTGGKQRVTVPSSRIVSNRPVRTIEPMSFYYFTRDAITATQFVFKTTADSSYLKEKRILLVPKTSIVGTSRDPLGSGVYGMYITEGMAHIKGDSTVYQIDGSSCYPLQDKEHGESLKTASLSTNRFLDLILELAQTYTEDSDINLHNMTMLVEANAYEPSYRLWRIVLMRTKKRMMTKEKYVQVLARYTLNFMTNTKLKDSETGEYIELQPVNWILTELGYNGIIADDPFNNGYDKGCVSYDLDLAEKWTGSYARY